MFNSNKISLGEINICLNQIFLPNKEIDSRRYNLFDSRKKFIWFEQVFIWSEDTLFGSNKFYSIEINYSLKSKKVFQTNNFLWFNQIFFLCMECYYTKIYLVIRKDFLKFCWDNRINEVLTHCKTKSVIPVMTILRLYIANCIRTGIVSARAHKLHDTHDPRHNSRPACIHDAQHRSSRGRLRDASVEKNFYYSRRKNNKTSNSIPLT